VPVIGTAGHVDHGKSTLVKALTGIDPDRLEEEKRRGLTIDLGFAWLTTPAGRQVGIVDVPGHERFIKNMLAGAGGIGLNLFVVAANEGWMPQSQEHLDIMDLLGISSAIVVITKTDTVDQSEVTALRYAIEERIQGTTLEGSTILEVTALTGRGLAELLEEIDSVLRRIPEPDGVSRTRLWIDRVFSIRGSGTVVTGTLAGGPVHTDQEVEILPGGHRARIRAIQSHRRELLFLGPGNRAALNLVGVEQQALARGDTLTNPGDWRVTDRLIASIRFLPHLDHEPQARGAYKFHVGSVEIDASLRFLEESAGPGESALAAIRLERPTVLDFKDRFILRDSGRRQTVGGGLVLEAHPARIRDRELVTPAGARARLSASDRPAYLQILLEEQGFLALQELPVLTGLKAAKLDPPAIVLPSFVLSERAFDLSTRQIAELLNRHQSSHPMEAGMPLTTLRSELRLPPQLLDELVAELVRRNVVRADSTAVRTRDFSPQVEGPEKMRLLQELDAAGASPPTVPELSTRHKPEMIRALIRSGELVQISPSQVFTSGLVDKIKAQIVERIRDRGPFTVADFRDMVATSRKYAVPLLEYLDHIGFTARQGDLRRLGPKATGLGTNR
jgi:selenocysteine-specific elongation factor